ncbi:MAG: hypothetical protein Q3965_02515 [Rothia sp. (in: high G+C Gram-positive bacteria)]|nr:hypothetical protein [Rothia sp. (in: high G+C Gram-positive bacteria)]
MLTKDDVRSRETSAKEHRSAVENAYRSQPRTFEHLYPGFFTTSAYVVLTLLLLLGFSPFLGFVLAFLGVLHNGLHYPAQHGVYYPRYFWFSVIAAFSPVLYILLALPVTSH